MDDAALALPRLRWRSRRGTRELDRLLAAWLDRHGADASQVRLADFAALLECQDPQLWDWIGANAEPEPRFAALVDEIRASHRV